jgi:hypothetical protein
MNAIAFTREVLAVFGEPRRMAARTALNIILRNAPKGALLTGERNGFVPWDHGSCCSCPSLTSAQPQNRLRVNGDLPREINLIWGVQTSRKNISLHFRPKSLSVRTKAGSDSQELTPRVDRGQFGILCIRFPQKTCKPAPVAATARQIRGNGRLFPPYYGLCRAPDEWVTHVFIEFCMIKDSASASLVRTWRS